MKLATLHKEIKQSACFPRGARILVAVSAGADSVALLHLLQDLAPSMQWRLGVAHLNHTLRGKHSDGDERFVRDLAKSLDLPCHVRRKQVALLARRAKISVEMKAREVRYAFLADIVRKQGYDIVALAHTMDDQAETLLLRLMRGAGLAGLGAMKAITEQEDLCVARPLLHVSKASLIRWLRNRNASWRDDASNKDAAYVRNRVRHELIPLMRERFNPKIVETLARTAEQIREDYGMLHAMALADWADSRVPGREEELDARRVRALPLARRRRVVLLWLIGAGVDEAHLHAETIERVCRMCLSSKGSAEAPVQEPLRVVRHYDRLAVSRTPARPENGHPLRFKLVVQGVTRLPEVGLRVRTAWTTGYKRPVGERCGQLPAEGYLSKAALGRASLYLRFRAEGDRFAPLGMKGEKKIQDIFVDGKVPRAQRDRVPLLECRKRIVWVPGYRVAGDWAVGNDAERSLHVTMERLA